MAKVNNIHHLRRPENTFSMTCLSFGFVFDVDSMTTPHQLVTRVAQRRLTKAENLTSTSIFYHSRPNFQTHGLKRRLVLIAMHCINDDGHRQKQTLTMYSIATYGTASDFMMNCVDNSGDKCKRLWITLDHMSTGSVILAAEAVCPIFTGLVDCYKIGLGHQDL